MGINDDKDGVSAVVRATALGSLLEDGYEGAPDVIRHLQPFGTTRTLCGSFDGYVVENTLGGVTCEKCRAEMQRRANEKDSRALAKLAKSRYGAIRLNVFDREARHRLTSAGYAEVIGASIVITSRGLRRVAEEHGLDPEQLALKVASGR